MKNIRNIPIIKQQSNKEITDENAKTIIKPNEPKKQIQNNEVNYEQLSFIDKFNKFIENTNLPNNPYVKIYMEIIGNMSYGKNINYTPKERIEFLANFANSKERINKPYLNNILVSHVTKIIGYFIDENEKKIFVVDVKNVKTSENETILVPEHVLLNKLRRKEIVAKNLDRKNKG